MLVPKDNPRLFYSVLEGLCCAELWNLHSRDRDRLARARVSCLASLAGLHREDAEACDRYLIALLEASDDRVEYLVYDLLCLDLGGVENTVYRFYDCCFVHTRKINLLINYPSRNF
jgi:hypothetical protein